LKSVVLNILHFKLYKINKVHSPAVEHDQSIVLGMPKRAFLFLFQFPSIHNLDLGNGLLFGPRH
jgi:hypothetical protein